MVFIKLFYISFIIAFLLSIQHNTNSAMTNYTYLLLLLFYLGSACGSAVSSSQVQICNRRTSQTTVSTDSCKSTFLIVLSVKSNNAKGSHLMVHVKDSKDERGDSIRLLEPYRIVVRKSAVHYDYPLEYIGDNVNNQLRESQPLLIQKNLFKGCSVELCPGERDRTGALISNSKGFCCEPTGAEKWGGQRIFRRGFSRQLSTNEIWLRSIAYCPKYDALWYGVYRPGQPALRFNIKVEVQRRSVAKSSSLLSLFRRTGSWETVDSATLSSAIGVSRLKESSADIKLEALGNFFLTDTLPDLSSKLVLVPAPISSQQGHEQVKAGAREWLLVDASRYEKNSFVCNKLGSEFKAFVSQPRKCYRHRGSCFQYSPRAIWLRDKWAVGNKTAPSHFPSAYGRFKAAASKKGLAKRNSPTYLRYLLEQIHTTELRLEFIASNISYVRNVATGRIVSTTAEEFRALGGGGQIEVTVVNSGHLTSTFLLSLEDCDDAVLPVGDRSFELNPSATHTIQFTVSVTIDTNANYSCMAVLRDSVGMLTDSKQVTFAARMSCYCPVACGCMCSPEPDGNTDVNTTTEESVNHTASSAHDMSMLQSECFSSESLFSLNITYTRPPCYSCYIINQMLDPVKIIVILVTLLLTLGMLKMLIEDCLCRDKERRRRRFVDSFLGSKSKYHKRHQVSENTVDWFLGACFFLYLPCLVCIAPLCRTGGRKKREDRERLREALSRYRMEAKRQRARRNENESVELDENI